MLINLITKKKELFHISKVKRQMTDCDKILVTYKIAEAKISNMYLYFLMKN